MIWNWWKKFIKAQYEYHFGTELTDLFNQINDLQNEIVILKKSLMSIAPVEKPKETGTVNLLEANILFKQAFPTAQIYLSDPIYTLTSVSEAERFLKQDLFNFKKFKTNEFDCDNFSKALWGYWQEWQSELALGILWISKPYAHALNVAILTENGKKGVYVIEPQNDKIYKVPTDYVGRLIVM